jgi:undecaprenyl-diphosphatase
LSIFAREEWVAVWRDFVAHWRKPRAVAGQGLNWALYGAAAVAAFVAISLLFDLRDAQSFPGYEKTLVAIFQRVTRLGESGWLFALSALACLFALARRAGAVSARLRARWGLLAAQAFYVFAVQCFSGLVSQIPKHLVGRARPPLFATHGAYDFNPLAFKSALASFPSGHTITGFAVAFSLAFFWPRRAWPLLALFAVAIGASRIIIGAHYPSDVTAGAFIGAASAIFVAQVFARRKIAFKPGDGFLPEAR